MIKVSSYQKGKDERGVALIFFLFSLFAILAILAIVIDLGRFETIIRSLQHTADAAALNAATTLNAEDTYSSLSENITYANVKKAVLTILTHGEMIGLDDAAKASLCINQPESCSIDPTTFRFDDASSVATYPDYPNYGNITGSRGNLTVTVQRFIFCYSNNSAQPVRNYFNLDDPTFTPKNTQFCKANAVKVIITMRDINIFFGRILGMTSLSSVTATSIAVMNQPMPLSGAVCQSTTCSALGIDPISGTFGQDCTESPFNPTP